MKLHYLLIPLFFFTNSVFSKQNKLLGQVSRADLLETPYDIWFNKEYNQYAPSPSTITPGGIEIKIFFGTWCGDSQKEVPRFLKILDSLGFTADQYELIAVDRTLSEYKKSPTGEEKGLNIYRVPSFLVYKNGELINRIIESPVSSLEEDLTDIVAGDPYTPNYFFTLNLDKNFKYLSKIKPNDTLVESESEILSYAISKLSDNNFSRALESLKFNTNIFPKYSHSYKYLAMVYERMGENKRALKYYKKYQKLNPEDGFAQARIDEIKNQRTTNSLK